MGYHADRKIFLPPLRDIDPSTEVVRLNQNLIQSVDRVFAEKFEISGNLQDHLATIHDQLKKCNINRFNYANYGTFDLYRQTAESHLPKNIVWRIEWSSAGQLLLPLALPFYNSQLNHMGFLGYQVGNPTKITLFREDNETSIVTYTIGDGYYTNGKLNKTTVSIDDSNQENISIEEWSNVNGIWFHKIKEGKVGKANEKRETLKPPSRAHLHFLHSVALDIQEALKAV